MTKHKKWVKHSARARRYKKPHYWQRHRKRDYGSKLFREQIEKAISVESKIPREKRMIIKAIEKNPDFTIKRYLRSVLSEIGEKDVVAEFEESKKKYAIYEAYDHETCLVELDEQPPYEINQEALQVSLQVAKLLNAKIVDEIQVMRKTVVDGSNTSGFQRTVLIARNGFVETEKGRVGIENISLEEDAARIVEEKEGKKIFRLDRLGIPLVEIGTAPDIKTPEQAKEVALYIGDVLRSCKVRRGIGTIRQDVNISIKGHSRIEIKGFQDVKMFIPTLEKEIERQKNNKAPKREVRNALPDGTTSFLRPMPGSARMYPETDLPLLRISRDIINGAKRTLPKLRSEVRGEYREKGLSEEMIKLLSHGDKIEEFEALLKIINEPNFIAKVLFIFPREIAKHSGKTEEIEDILNLDIIESIIQAVKDGKISCDDVKHVMEEIVRGKSFEEAVKLKKVDLGDVESEIAEIVKEKPGLSIGGYMGLIMQKFKGKVSGKDVNEILKKLLK